MLTEAVAAGKPVISTSFPHAVELLSGVPASWSPSATRAPWPTPCEHVLTAGGAAATMAAVSRGLAPSLLWPAVAARYLQLAESLRAAPIATVA